MKILLINPPLNRLKGLKVVNYPLGLGYLAGSLKAAGHDVRIWNAEMPKEPAVEHEGVRYAEAHRQHGLYVEALKNPDHAAWKEAAGLLAEHKPDLVGITAVSSKIPSALKIAAIAKAANRECHVTLGGAHPTIRPDEVLQDANVDSVVRGEGEHTIVELSNALARGERNFERIGGLSFRRESRLVHNPHRELIENLDSLPLPARDVMIDQQLYPPSVMGSIVTSRGCPYRCGYCAAKNIWTRKVRYRSAGNVVDEVEQVKRTYGTRHFDLWDDSFTVNRKKAVELCEEIIRRKLDIDWWCMTRADLVDGELLHLMREAGCGDIAIGIETGSERTMKLIQKEVSLDQCVKAIEMIHRNHICTTAFMMMGFPEETEDDIRKTIEFTRRLRVSSIRMAVFTPYPGSELYETAEKLGLIPEHVDWSHFNRHSPENHFVKDVSKERFRELVDETIRLVDRQNHGFATRMRNLRIQLPYLLRHPAVLGRRIAGKIKLR